MKRLAAQNHLVNNAGISVVGIFRLAPSRTDCLWAKQQINEGEFNGCADVNIIANLIKVFFRELPVALLDAFDDEEVCRVAEMTPGESVMTLAKAVVTKPPGGKVRHSLLLWLLDLMSEVVQNSAVNKMTAKNIATVISPNLFTIDTADPTAAVTMSRKVADFCEVLLKSRLRTRWRYECE